MPQIAINLETREDKWKIHKISAKVNEFNAVIIASTKEKWNGATEQRQITLSARQVELLHLTILKMKQNAVKTSDGKIIKVEIQS